MYVSEMKMENIINKLFAIVPKSLKILIMSTPPTNQFCIHLCQHCTVRRLKPPNKLPKAEIIRLH